MKKILITGATGNVGFEVIRFLEKSGTPNAIIAGVRNIENAKKLFKDFPKIDLVNFDFEQPETFDNALKNIDIIFLLRPPHISDIEKYFRPLIQKIKEYKVNEDHRNLYVFDRGVSSLNTYNSMNEQQAQFVCRIKTNRKIEVVRSLMNSTVEKALGSLELVSDEIIHLFDHDKKCFSNVEYRLIVAKRKEEQDIIPNSHKGKYKKVQNELFFLTNNFEMSAKQVAECYKKRWDIEVFFRFIKQELNFKHFLSVNENGLQVMLYMTLIAAMLLMLYKRINEIGFVTAKRRFTMEIEDMITAMAIIYCGGDIEKYGEIDYQRHIPK